jgi:transposase InsO family protein
MVETTAERVADAFFTHFYMHHGLPRAITSDRGSQFVSAFWRVICEKLSIQRRLSTAFHPQSDGATERANQEVERILRAFTTYTQDNWGTLLPIVATAINNRNASATGLSPFFFTHGYHVDPIKIEETEESREPHTRPGIAGETFVNRLREATDWAQAAIASAQAQQEEQSNKRRQAAPVYKKGD